MEIKVTDITPHPRLTEFLFAYKGKVFSVFRDILGLYDIHHISITHVNEQNQLITLSSTPAIEFNLFNSNLWQYDKTYSAEWFKLCTHADWQSLYLPSRYDELYYIKQIKHKLPAACSLAATMDKQHFIFSMASHKNCPQTIETFKMQYESFYKIGQYCSNILKPILTHSELDSPLSLTPQD